MSLEDDLPITAPTDEGDRGPRRRMPGQNKLRREGGRSPLLEDQYRTNLHTAIRAKEGAPRTLEDIPENLRKPLRPPARKASES